jgi:two-component system, LytTR family, sensor kinase
MEIRYGVKTVCLYAFAYAVFVFTTFFHYERTWHSSLTFLLLLTASFVVWMGSIVILSKVREHLFERTIYVKLLTALALQTIFLTATILLGALFFNSVSKAYVDENSLLVWLKYTFCFGAGFTLLSEVLYLSRERQLDALTIGDLEEELRESEIEILKNELDPHFVYNTLVPLSYLIENDACKAKEFTHRLLQVYQYLLENKNRSYTTVARELDFSKSYFFLLQVRYKEAISLSIVNKCGIDLEEVFVLPFSLQILLENAVKHNSFNQEQPLHVQVIIDEKTLTVRNNLSPTNEKVRSTGIGLKNLKARFRLVANATILFTVTQQYFTARLPLRNNSDIYDKNSYHRRRFFNF